MKTLGIIGGFGPETTAKFQLAIIELCRDLGADIRPEIIMWNAPIPLQMEKELILQNQGIETFLPFLIKGAKLLEKSGASILVLPCNTLHVFIDEIRAQVTIPVLSITEITIEHLIKLHVKSVAVMGTKAAMAAKLYVSNLSAVGITPVLPTQHEQNAIDQVVFDILNVKAHRRSTRVLDAIATECIGRGANDVLLACTDLQIVFPNLKDARVHDTMHLLAEACVREVLSQ